MNPMELSSDGGVKTPEMCRGTDTADGGAVILSSGAKGVGGKDGPIIFKLASGMDVIRFEADGAVYVRGERVDSNPLVYQAVMGERRIVAFANQAGTL